jgi:hypothetical protein
MKRIGLMLLLACASALAQQKANANQQTDAHLDSLTSQGIKAQQAQLEYQQAQLLAQQAELTHQLDRLRQTHSESHPDVVNLELRLDKLNQELDYVGRLGGNWTPYVNRPANPPSLGGLQTGRPDKWWNSPPLAAWVGLTTNEQKKMDDVFQQYRLKLIDLNAALEKEEATLEPLVAAARLDESKIAAQIDRVAQARADLEKANGRMLLGIRKMLTQEQWNRLQRGTQ